MTTEPLTEGKRLFLTFLFGLTGSLFASFLFKQTQAPVTPIAEEEPLEDE